MYGFGDYAAFTGIFLTISCLLTRELVFTFFLSSVSPEWMLSRRLPRIAATKKTNIEFYFYYLWLIDCAINKQSFTSLVVFVSNSTRRRLEVPIKPIQHLCFCAPLLFVPLLYIIRLSGAHSHLTIVDTHLLTLKFGSAKAGCNIRTNTCTKNINI